MTNRLAAELSPYLQQHAQNPVDWFPWGQEALSKAKREDKPILLSIGYSACHWCHVMEHESFDNPEIAELMNQLFVSIKVDREERPDLDQIYQLAAQLMTRRAGGWPLTVFLTPALTPFYAGTYFPPEERHGMPGFPNVLVSVAKTFADNRDDVDSLGAEVVDALEGFRVEGGDGRIEPDFLLGAARKLQLNFDDRYGGFGDAPKFPNTMSLEAMLRAHVRGAPDPTLSRVRRAVDAMIEGGIHDHLGGGFHRYTVDARWRIPHFEKMLYDNALLVRLMTDLWSVTSEERYRRAATKALEYVEREMTAETGGFYSSQDADSEGKEGTFFVWTPSQLEEVLGKEDARLAAKFFGVDDAGNFEEGTTVLHQTRSVDALGSALGMSAEDAQAGVERVTRKLFEAREARPKPFRDDKVIASWNGLMIDAAARAGGTFGDARWVRLAERALDFVEGNLWKDGELLRIYKDQKAQTRGFLVDYVEVANAAVGVYGATHNPARLRFAAELVDEAIARFWDPNKAAFYFAKDESDLIVRTEDTFDNAVPSGAASAAHALLRLHALIGDERYLAVADKLLTRLSSSAAQNPSAHAHLLSAIDHWVHGPTQIVIAGARDDADTRALYAAAGRGFLLDRAVIVSDPSEDDPVPKASPLIPDKPLKDGKATAYVCRDRTCSAPVTDPAALEALIGEITPRLVQAEARR